MAITKSIPISWPTGAESRRRGLGLLPDAQPRAPDPETDASRRPWRRRGRDHLCLAKTRSGSKPRQLRAVKAHKSQLLGTGKLIWHCPISTLRCSRFCACQSTQEPQVSIWIRRCAVNISINITYFLQISISFNKSLDLFWEQRVGGSNPSAPTSRTSGTELLRADADASCCYSPLFESFAGSIRPPPFWISKRSSNRCDCSPNAFTIRLNAANKAAI
jgi:hypothetical protein